MVGGMPLVGSGQKMKPRGAIKKKKECKYDEGGLCSLHGVVGTLKWKPTNVLAVGDDGKMKYEYRKVNYYECDVEPRGRGRPGQKRLSSLKTTSPRTPIQNDNKFKFKLSTSKEGQSTPVRKQTDDQQACSQVARK